MRYVVSICSNSEAELHVRNARETIRETFPCVRFSSVRVTEPQGVGYPKELMFWNSVAVFDCNWGREPLKAWLKNLETREGRTDETRQKKIVPLDLDIIMIDGKIVHDDYERFGFLRNLIDELKVIV